MDGKEGPADVCVIELGGTVGLGDFKLSEVFGMNYLVC